MLVQTRPEKMEAMSKLAHALREVAVGPARNGELNLAETINASAHLMASILAGAYGTKDREVVLSMLPDLIRCYFQQWDDLYKDCDPHEGD